jgi:RNA polymerase sigma-70 factor (ECF subfamily)
MAGATTLGEMASAIGVRQQEAAIVSELKAGSEQAYAWLIGEFQRPVYGLVYRMIGDSADAADTTQDVFLKVFRGMKHFHGSSSLKTWIYRIAIHEAANRKRWWFRHKSRETAIDGPDEADAGCGVGHSLEDHRDSPFDCAAHREVQLRVDEELHKLPEPYRTTVILRDLEEMSYEEIAEVLEISLGTVKSRLTRGRDMLKVRLTSYVQSAGEEMGLLPAQEKITKAAGPAAATHRRVEVTP